MKDLDNMQLPVSNDRRFEVEEKANKLTRLILKSISEIEKEDNYKFTPAEKIAVYTSLINRQSQNLILELFGDRMLP